MINKTKLIDRLKAELIKRAEKRFPDESLGPAGNKNHLDECFTIDKMGNDYNILMLWYNVGKNTYAESVQFDHTKIKPKEKKT